MLRIIHVYFALPLASVPIIVPHFILRNVTFVYDSVIFMETLKKLAILNKAFKITEKKMRVSRTSQHLGQSVLMGLLFAVSSIGVVALMAFESGVFK